MASNTTTSGSKSEFHVIQVNLGRAFKANESLSNFQHDEQFDISVVQEPYTLHNKVIGFPIKHKIIAFSNTPKTAIIVHKEDIAIFPLIIEQNLLAAKIKKGNREIVVVNCYCPPRESVNATLSKIENFIRNSNYLDILIMGDFNAKAELWGSHITDEKGDKIIEFIVSNNLTLLNERTSPPTFRTSRAKGWIDLAFVTSNLFKDLQLWEVLKIPNYSDHRYIQVKFDNIILPDVYGLTLKGEMKVLEELKEDNWFEIKQAEIHTVQDIDEVVDTFYKKVDELKSKYSKIKGTSKQNPKPWWSIDLEMERKRVRACRRRYQKARGDIRKKYKEEYYKEHDTYNKMIQEAKSKSWRILSSKITKNPFNLAYKIARNQIKSKVILKSILKEDGSYTTSLTESIEYLLDKFYPTEDGNVSDFEVSLPQRNKGNVGIIRATELAQEDDVPFTEIEVNTVVNSLRKDVAPGPDGIKTSVVQAIYKQHKTFFVNLFNACLRTGYFPKKWKQAKVILIPKAKSEDKPEDKRYRPIAINSILGKVLEKLIKDRLYHFLYKNNHLNKYQFGFTHNTSTTQALQEIKKRIARAKIDKMNIILVSLDIKNAFNSIQPKIVTSKLEEYQCHRNLIKLTDSILTEREIIFEDGTIRVVKSLAEGSPQGSPLSPLYWNLTVSGLLECRFPQGSHVQAFADDIVVMVEFKSRNEAESNVNEVLNIVNRWARRSKITLNNEKSEFMIVGKQYGNHPPGIKIGNDKIKIVNEMRILGVIFDNKLTFLPHLKYLKEKVAELTYNLSRTIKDDKDSSRTLLQLIYKKGIERMINYASPVWYTKKVIILRKLRSIQRLPLILVTKAFKTTSNASLNVLAKIPPVHLTIQKENEQHEILRNGKSFSMENETFLGEQIMQKYDHWQDHPAKKIVIPVVDKEEEVNFKIYTDGSKREKEVGAAFIVLDCNNVIVLIRRYKLPGYASNFDAEVLAIQKAVEYIVCDREYNSYQLYTDSLSTLNALKNPCNSNPMIVKIKKLITINAVNLKLSYVKGHSNTLGNDLADEQAKKASESGEYTFIPIKKSIISRELQLRLTKEWKDLWNKEGKASYTYTWIPNVNLIPEHFPTNFYSAQAVTGHGRFPFYFQRFGISQNSLCSCKEEAENFDHYLNDCKLVTEERTQMVRELGPNLGKRKPEIIKNEQTRKILEAMVLKINDFVMQMTK